MQTKSVFEKIEQKNRLASYVFGSNASKSTERQKMRILNVLFEAKCRRCGHDKSAHTVNAPMDYMGCAECSCDGFTSAKGAVKDG